MAAADVGALTTLLGVLEQAGGSTADPSPRTKGVADLLFGLTRGG